MKEMTQSTIHYMLGRDLEEQELEQVSGGMIKVTITGTIGFHAEGTIETGSGSNTINGTTIGLHGELSIGI